MNPKNLSTSETLNPAIVESIVRRVMERLSEIRKVEKDSSSDASADNTSAGTSSVFRTADRVITLESLRGKLEGLSRLVVRSDAVITPLVKDETRSLGVTIEREGASSGSTQSQNNLDTAAGACLARLSSHFVPLEWLKKAGVNQVCCGEDYEEMAERLAANHAEGKTVCLSAQPYVAVASLNRNGRLRAAFGRTKRDVQEISSTLHANVLVLDSVQPRTELFELVLEFVHSNKGAGQ